MKTLAELLDTFRTEDDCFAYLVAMRWPDGVACPRCGSLKVHKLTRPWRWQCKQCAKQGYRFSPLVGTIFENTNVKLRDWFQVIYLMCQSKKGISALQVQRMIKAGSYRTAWYMCHRIRAAMKSEAFRALTGVVEVDETYIGGKDKNKHLSKIPRRPKGGGRRGGRGPAAGKNIVIGAISRKGNVVAKMIENTDAATLQGFVRETVASRVKLVATDDHHSYYGLARQGYPHGVVRHSRREYVHGNVHTANIDSFWSMIKRGIMGSFHNVSKDYLPLYLNEFSYRYNNRKNPDMFSAVIASA